MKVLVIDDDHNIGGVIAGTLSSLCNHEPPRFADNVPEAMQLLAQENFDLVTLDLRLPGWPIERTLAEIRPMRELNGEGLIVVVTGVGEEPELVDRVMEAGAHGFIFKPMVRHRETFFGNLRALALSLTRQPTKYQRNLELAERLINKLTEAESKP